MASEVDTTCPIMVPATKVGRIIGKKGAKIRELEETTRTRIKINRSDGDEVRVDVQGDKADVEEAKYLIQQLTQEDSYGGYGRREQNRGYGGGGGGGGGGYEGRSREQQNGRGGDRNCYNCGGSGHLSRNCPGESRQEERSCQTCGEMGHLSRDCPGESKNEEWDSYQPKTYVNSSRNNPNESSKNASNGVAPEEEDWDAEIANNPRPNFVADLASFKVLNAVEEDDRPSYGRNRGRGQNRASEYGECRSIKPSYRRDNDQSNKEKKKSLQGTLMWAMKDIYDTPKPNHMNSYDDKPIDFEEMRRQQDEYDRQKFADMPPVIKEFYKEHPNVTRMSDLEVAEYRKKENDIQVINLAVNEGQDVPKPVTTFEEAFHNYQGILDEVKRQGFKKPSPIQSQAWPVLMQGKDMIGVAQTGTGKTLAFLLPALIHICGQPIPRVEREGPTVLIMCPTRELALQIQDETTKIKYKNINCVCLYGGGSRRKQIEVVTRGVDIVVATPGRLNDLINAGVLSLKCVTFLVLDEADRMLDLGFEPQIRLCMLDIRPDRQTVMTSATWPPGVQELAERYMKKPIQINVGSLDLAAVHSVTQIVEILYDDEKKERLFYFLSEELTPEDKVIVFVGRKVTADDIASDLAIEGIACRCIHGDREQADREQCVKDLKSGETRVLIATDVASRGLDVKDITYVFNFDFPRNIEEYVHRIGRTGRAGKTGTAITLMTRSDWRSAQALIDIMVEANQEVPDGLQQMADRYTAHQQQAGPRGRYGPQRIRYNNSSSRY